MAVYRVTLWNAAISTLKPVQPLPLPDLFLSQLEAILMLFLEIFHLTICLILGDMI